MEVLADAQVAFGGLDGGVAEGELDLLERHPALVSELGEGTTQVVGGNLHSDPPAVMDDQPFSGPAHAAAMVVAGQYFLAQAAEAGAGAAPAPVAGQAPPPAKQLEAAAGAAERDLRVEGHGVSH